MVVKFFIIIFLYTTVVWADYSKIEWSGVNVLDLFAAQEKFVDYWPVNCETGVFFYSNRTVSLHTCGDRSRACINELESLFTDWLGRGATTNNDVGKDDVVCSQREDLGKRQSKESLNPKR